MWISLADFIGKSISLQCTQTLQVVLSLKSRVIAANARYNGSHRHPLPEDSNKPGRVAQLAEHSTLNRQVEGSIPSASTTSKPHNHNQMPIKKCAQVLNLPVVPAIDVSPWPGCAH